MNAQRLDEAVATLKQVTRRYAREQDKFIRNRFQRPGVPLTKLDTSDVAVWDDKVR